MRYGGWDCSPGSATRGLRCAGGTLWPLRRRWDNYGSFMIREELLDKIWAQKVPPKNHDNHALWRTRNRFKVRPPSLVWQRSKVLICHESCVKSQLRSIFPGFTFVNLSPGWREVLVELTSFWAWGQVGWDIQIWFTDLTGNRCNSCKRLRWLRTYHIHDRSWIWGMIIHLLLYHIISYYIILLYPHIISTYHIHFLIPWRFLVSRLWGDADLVDAFHWSFRLLAQLLVRTDQQSRQKLRSSGVPVSLNSIDVLPVYHHRYLMISTTIDICQ